MYYILMRTLMNMKNKYRVTMIDGDILVYKSAFIADKYDDDSMGKLVAYQMKERIFRDLPSDERRLYLTGKGNFRESVAKTVPYKGQRPARPKHYQAIRGYFENLPETTVIDGMEADDALGIDQIPGETVIASIDKDLLMIPGSHYNITTRAVIEASDPGELTLTKDKNRTKITGYGFKWFCAQMLMGDTVDNIKGLYRVGATKAYKALKDCKDENECWGKVLEMYVRDKALSRLEENTKLLWILRGDTNA